MKMTWEDQLSKSERDYFTEIDVGEAEDAREGRQEARAVRADEGADRRGYASRAVVTVLVVLIHVGSVCCCPAMLCLFQSSLSPFQTHNASHTYYFHTQTTHEGQRVSRSSPVYSLLALLSLTIHAQRRLQMIENDFQLRSGVCLLLQ